MLLIPVISFSQSGQDSIAHIKKATLKWYIKQAYRAQHLYQDSIRQSVIILDLEKKVEVNALSYEKELAAEREKTSIAWQTGYTWKDEMKEIKVVLQNEVRRQKILKWVGFATAGVATVGFGVVAIKN